MISDSLILRLLFDLLIAGIAGTLIVYVIKVNGFGDSGRFSPGRWLLLGGILLVAVFHLLHSIAISALPRFLGPEQAGAIGQLLHHEAGWVVSLVSMGMICAGIFLLLNQRQMLVSRVRESEDLLDRVRHSAVRSESRFRAILEQTPYSIYSLAFDPPFELHRGAGALADAVREAQIVECNTAFAKVVERGDVPSTIGMRFGELDSPADTDSHEQFICDFVAAGCRLTDYELSYVDPQGQRHMLQINWDSVIRHGALHRIWAAEQDIFEIRQTKAELARRKRFEKLVARISTKLIVAPETSLNDELRKCLRLVCEYSQADRAALLWLNNDTQDIELLSYWNKHGAPPAMLMSRETFPWIAGRLLNGAACVIHDVEQVRENSQRDFDSLSALGVKSAACVSLSVGGSAQGALIVSTVNEQRHWSQQAMHELDVLGGLFGNTIWRIRSRQELDVALAELQKARDHLEAENVYLQQELRSTHGFDGLIGESHSFMKSLRQVEQVAATKTAVLIQGETGTGKELIARAVHARSDRNKRPLVKVNCAALPGNLIESELFGHEKGAFTGAQTHKRGRFDLAHRGTLFLDEIGDLPLDLQGKLLRVLQEGEFERLGGTETTKVDVRLIAATNRNLREAVDRGEFRADLYYRISTFPIELPPLRDREGDVPLLAKHFVRKYAKQLGKNVTGVSNAMLEQLQSYSWPGNVRELESVVQRAIIYTHGRVVNLVEPLQTSQGLRTPEESMVAPGETVDLRKVEREHIRGVLQQSHWVIGGSTGAAARLGLPPSTLRSKMKKLGIERPLESA
ncbi:MAG: sigma 54-interacting transcriptional regulator [Gammaproteobacteria bacterium]|nr:sigma 54-interacting transcriptional regulator [Gammaproteobacteria bacterium]